jgi:phosphoribosylformimino-5-aminoimidazole carboxamide ribotide isomerase
MIEIIPAIDLIGGKCVRLSQGDYGRKTVYNENPLEVARSFEDAGIRRLHLVDLDGAKAQHIVNHKVLKQIATHTSLIIDFGGGLKTDEDLRIAFENGAQMITGGSIAVKNPAIFSSWIARYGSEKIILGADVRNRNISVTGWTEDSDLELIPFVHEYREQGITKVICTEISRDGMMQGPATEMYQEMLSHFPGLFLIASGGISCVADLERLEEAGIPAAITGKAIYEGAISMKDLQRFLSR